MVNGKEQELRSKNQKKYFCYNSRMETDKSRAERLIQGLFDKQGAFKKKPLTYDENIEDGLRSAFLSFNKKRNRWELAGKFSSKLKSSLLIDRAFNEGKIVKIDSKKGVPETEQAINVGFDGKIQIALDQLELWNSRSPQHYYIEAMEQYIDLRKRYLNFEPVDIYVSQIMNPGYDYALEPKVTVQLHQSLV